MFEILKELVLLDLWLQLGLFKGIKLHNDQYDETPPNIHSTPGGN